jgi:hypothetical protein
MALRSVLPPEEIQDMTDIGTMGFREGDWVLLPDEGEIAKILHFEPLFKSATCGPCASLQGIGQGYSGRPRMVPVINLKRARVQAGRKFQYRGTDDHWHDIP